MNDKIKFGYLKDPANPNRVVTLAWTQTSLGDKLDVRYAFAINRVASPRNRPEKVKSGLQKHHDRHCKKIGRAVAAGRHAQNVAETCSHNLFDADKPVLVSIVDDYLSVYDWLTEKLSEEIEAGPTEHDISLHTLIMTRRSQAARNRKLKKLLSMRKSVKEVFERTKKWREGQVR